jgi:hypothetical protein
MVRSRCSDLGHWCGNRNSVVRPGLAHLIAAGMKEDWRVNTSGKEFSEIVTV